MSNKLKKKSKTIDNSNTSLRIKLSQCMIVKNEEENIKKALSWAKDIAFEQIVVDTGSTDRTVEIAKEMGAKVYYFEWINDFSAAKNFAIEQAKGDWIAFLDADEYINEKETRYLLRLLEKLQQPDINNKYANIVRLPIVNINDNGKVISTHLQQRVFRNIPGIRYEGRIHENISVANPDDNIYFYAEDIRIMHTGYRDSISEQKGIRNTPILEEIVAEHPDDYDSLSYLADSISSKGDEIKAIGLYQKCVDNIDNIESLTRKYNSFLELIKLLINQNYPEDIITNFYHKFYKRYPLSPDPKYLLACYYFKTKQYKKAAEDFNLSLELLFQYTNEYPLISIFCREDVIRGYLGHSYFNLENYEKALENYIIYQKANKDDEQVLTNLLYIISQEKLSVIELNEYIRKILSALYNLNDIKDVLICLKVCMQLGFLETVDWLKSKQEVLDNDKI